MKVLVTAFDPFGGEAINPALEAVNKLPEQIGSIEIIKETIPTVFGKSICVIGEAIERSCPDAVICVGQAGGRSNITIERVAINCADASIKDNEGKQPIDESIEKDGPAAYFSTLPIKQMAEAVKKAGIPAAVSNTAGTFVCNQLLYGVLHKIEQKKLPIRAGFIHVPYIPAQAALKKETVASMALSDIVCGLTAAIRVLEECN